MEWIKEQQVKLSELVTDLKQRFKIGQRNFVFGLDIGSSAIKMVQLQKNGGGYSVTAAGFADIDERTEGGNAKDIDIARTIHHCVQSAGIQTKLAVCGVCGPETVVRHFTFPSLQPEEIEGAVMLEAKQICPFNTDDGVVDYQVMPGATNDVNGILVAATNKVLQDKTGFAGDAVLGNVLMDIDGLALLNCFRGCEEYEANETIAVLNVGKSCATLAIIGDDNLPSIRDINYAGKAIIEQIAVKHSVSARTIEDILIGREGSDDTPLQIHDDLEAACHKLVVDVTETLRYYAVRRKSEMAKKIFVCGGLAIVEGFVDLLNKQLPTAVLWNPFDKISCDALLPCADLLRKKGPALAVAAGLAMRTI